ncbi:MAG: T9SS type A sorting domain-containing protein [Saprospiraceae bacterium]
MKRILFLLISCSISIQVVAQNFSIIVMPDTQHYCDFGPTANAIFSAQTQWIVDTLDELNVVFVTGLGDIVQNAQLTSEWDLADDAYSLIEDPATTLLTHGIPYGLVVGNHDQWPKRTPGATTNFNSYFGVSRFSGRSYYGGGFPATKNDNSYQLFSGGGMDFIIIHIEFDESDNPPNQSQLDVIDWADGLLTTHSDRRAIISSHYIIDRGNQADGDADFGDQGERIFDSLSRHENLFLMLGGHEATEGERVDSVGPTGNKHAIYTLLSDYQNQPNGGNGWLRIMEFIPSEDSIKVSTYSPTLDAYGDTPFDEMGEINVANSFGGDGSISAPFKLHYEMTPAPLPVELVDFKVRKEGKESLISWETASEDNNKGFEIQKSTDGERWEKLTWIDGYGTTTNTQSYSYVDTEPHRGDNYYRLRQVDFDDKEDFSAVRVVTFDFVLEAPVIYPNPVLDELTIEMPSINTGKVTFEIRDINGRVIMNERVNLEDEIHKINTSSLIPGIYYLDIQSQSSLTSYPFTKTK